MHGYISMSPPHTTASSENRSLELSVVNSISSAHLGVSRNSKCSVSIYWMDKFPHWTNNGARAILGSCWLISLSCELLNGLKTMSSAEGTDWRLGKYAISYKNWQFCQRRGKQKSKQGIDYIQFHSLWSANISWMPIMCKDMVKTLGIQ